MNIYIKEIPHEDHLFSTLGDWWIGDANRNIDQNGDIYIIISKIGDWRYFWAILFHELVEIAWCLYHGVTSEMCEAFDVMWEQEIKQGIQKAEDEAGFDIRCPYKKGHEWGVVMETIICKVLHIDWAKYCRDCEDIFK